MKRCLKCIHTSKFNLSFENPVFIIISTEFFFLVSEKHLSYKIDRIEQVREGPLSKFTY